MRHFIGVMIVGAVVAALIGPRGPFGGFWAPPPDAPHLHGSLRAGFVAWNLVEDLAFGVGLAILLLGRRWFAARIATAPGATTVWLATVWLFASWMPHAALHQHVGMRAAAILPIEWVFHGGAIAATGALLWALSNTPAQLAPRNSNNTMGQPRVQADWLYARSPFHCHAGGSPTSGTARDQQHHAHPPGTRSFR